MFECSQASPSFPSGKSSIKMSIIMERWGNNTERGNRSTRRKTYLSVTLSTTNLTRAGPESSAGLPGERLEIKRLSHGTVLRGLTLIYITQFVLHGERWVLPL